MVISNEVFSRYTGLAVVCPITNTDRGHPFHVRVPEGSETTGFVMAEQVKSIDYIFRKARLVGAAPDYLVEDVLGLLDSFFSMGKRTR